VDPKQASTLGRELIRIGASLRLHPTEAGHLQADPGDMEILSAIISKISNIPFPSVITEFERTYHHDRTEHTFNPSTAVQAIQYGLHSITEITIKTFH